MACYIRMKKRVTIVVVVILTLTVMMCLWMAKTPKGQRLLYHYKVSALESLVLGKTESQLRAIFPEITPVSGSFSILVSKNLHPYHIPPNHTLFRLGSDYIVFELQNGRVISVHRVSG